MHFEFCNCILHLAFCNCILHFAITGHLFCNKRTIAKYKFQAFFPIQSATNFIMIQNLDLIFGDDFSSWRFFHYFLLRIKCKRNRMTFQTAEFDACCAKCNTQLQNANILDSRGASGPRFTRTTWFLTWMLRLTWIS